jgi:alkyldihydroxyacetonephosphate synthase
MNDRSWWGWGRADAALDDDACRTLAERRVRSYLPLDGTLTPVPEVPPLRPPRLKPPEALPARADDATRAAHAYGKAYRDVVRALAGDLDHPPDLVAYPVNETDIRAVLDWAAAGNAVVVPYGGGSCVVGGVEYRGDRPWLSLDLSRLDAVHAVDAHNLAVHVQAGVFGPALEAALRPHGLTLRHYPQSFEFSTVGGWLATRSGGHFATGPTHVDDLVEAVRAVTPVGVAESLRVPASGAGPSPDRLWLGSEGTLAVITGAWLRVRPRPRFTAATAVAFQVDAQSLAATRAVAQSGLLPSNCRLLDPLEAAVQTGVPDGSARLLLGFESADAPVDAALARAVELCRDHGGEPVPGTVERWRGEFLRAPYLRDALVRLGVVVETVETACLWDRFEPLRDAVVAAARAVAPGAIVSCRFSHVYPDGPAPYFTVLAPGRRGSEVAIWDEIKAAVNDAVAANGGTVTHHHAVGRDHRRWYDAQRPEPFAAALRAAKTALDPHGVLNPGVLFD